MRKSYHILLLIFVIVSALTANSLFAHNISQPNLHSSEGHHLHHTSDITVLYSNKVK